MAVEDFFKFNKSNEFRFSNYKEIKEEGLKGADEKTKKLFNIFAGDDKILQEVEAKSLFNVLKSVAGDNQILEENEIKAFAKEHIGEEVDTNALMTFVNNIFGTKEKTQTQAVQVAKGYAAQKQQTFLEEAACKEIVIDIIDENLSEAYEILNSQYLGSISGWHDERKDKNDVLKTSNVSKVLDYQNAGIAWMNKAKIAPPNGLTKKEYYEGNKQRIKDMILTRVLVLDINTKFKELKNKYPEEKLAQIIGDYVEQLCSNALMEDLKDIQKQFISYSGVEEIQALENVVDNAIKFNADKNKPMPYSEVPLPKFDNSKGIVPEYWNTDEPISFEEVYKIERGTEYSQYKIEQYALAKKEMEVVANAYNKKQQFIEFAEGLRKDETLNIDEKIQKVLEGFATFYALAEDGGLSQLKELIAESKLPISIDENGFNFGSLDDNAKNRALNSLLKLAQQSKEKEFEKFLNGKTIEDYQIALAQAHDEAIGDENGKMMAEAMKNDNLTCIQRWTGNTSMAGMGMTIVGGILCFTPLAPLGAGMITVGNTLAIGGMVAETGLGVADYATKDVQTTEEAEQLGKNFLMNAGGFIIGIGAGKAGMKAFSNLIDEKLVAVFGQQIASGNKMQALKTVFTNSEYLKNFMTAAGAKLSADFVISYAGDLAMMGILDTQDDWQSLLKANLTGILVGMSGDIKDVSGVGRPRNFGVSDGVRPMTEMDYGQRLLGNDVTVADPKTGATVEGTVTGLYSQDGQVEIEVNGQRFSTNDVAEVRGEAKVEAPKEVPKAKTISEIQTGKDIDTKANQTLAIDDPIYADISAFSEYLHSKLEAQMCVIKPEEISAWADNISAKYGISKQEVLEIMSRLTQFGSYSRLIPLGEKLSALNIRSFYKDSGLSSNLVYNYLAESKQQIEITGKKQAFILDDAGLKYLENLDKTAREDFGQKVKDGNIVLINLDGSGLKIGENYYSYTLLDGDQSLEAMTEMVVAQLQEGKSLDEVLNAQYQERIQTLFGEEIASMVENVSINPAENVNATTIASQLKPNMPDAKTIAATIEVYTNRHCDSPEEAIRLKSLLTKYVDYTIKVNSNDSFAKELKQKYVQLQEKVAELGKSMDDVIYVYPASDKSYVLVQYMYAKVNNVPTDRFIEYDGTTPLPSGKVIVVMDDVVSSGASMTGALGLGFIYSKARANNPDSNIIFAPILCADEGYELITSQIKENDNRDILLVNDVSKTKVNNFLSQLSLNDRTFLIQNLGNLGYDSDMLCVSFPYMIPDNCCEFSGLLLDFCLNFTAEQDANKVPGFVDLYKQDIIESLGP